MKQIDKTALLDWEKFKEDIARATPVAVSYTHLTLPTILRV